MAKTPSLHTFDLACAHLAAILTPHGFACRKSKRDCRRQGHLFEHIVTFGTSRSVNSLPGHVHLEVRAMAWSDALAEYRKVNGIRLPINEAVLFATTVENLFRPAPPYVRYDVGAPQTRDENLRQVAAVLEGDVLRAFGLVESPAELRAALEAGPIPCLTEEAVRDYFGCFADG